MHPEKTVKMKRKTPLQLEALNNIYLEENYPTQREMEEYATDLGLTYNQVRNWFVERRGKEKRGKGKIAPSHSSSTDESGIHRGINLLGAFVAGNMHKSSMSNCDSSSALTSQHNMLITKNVKKKKKLNCPQELLPPDYILKKVFRKDGPPLGVEFDTDPSESLGHHTAPTKFASAFQYNQGPTKRRKGSNQAIVSHWDFNRKAPAKRHGIGKGLMTVWRATYPGAGDFPADFGLAEKGAGVPSVTKSISQKSRGQKKRSRQVPLAKQGRLGRKLQDRRNLLSGKRQVKSHKDVNTSQKEKCELAFDRALSQEELDRVSMLVDDEELELKELRASSDALVCTEHHTFDGMHGCPLCKDVLDKFPPDSVKMKKPFCGQPWESSPEIVKKLFKVFHFLYTYAVVLDLCPFTLDEFVQSFHDKDLMLLGKIHVSLLLLLLSDVEVELSNGFLPHLNKSCNYLALLQSIGNQEFSLEFWKMSLNPLTWIEILRQVLVAAGFGSKQGALRRDALSKEMSLLVKYGLRPGTLKGELFRILAEKGNNGSVVSELAKSVQIVDLSLARTTGEVESLICSTLSSDITLFEKISSSAYRLRISSLAKDMDEFQSDTEDSGGVDDELNDSGTCSSSDDSGCESGKSSLKKLKRINQHRNKNSKLTVNSEIDESHPGEVWLLGMMEGEYSDLSIEEKLNAIVALTDLLYSGSRTRMKDPTDTIVQYNSGIYHGSGAKIKRSSAKQHSYPGLFHSQVRQLHGVKVSLHPHEHPVDSSFLVSNFQNYEVTGKEKESKETAEGIDLHPIQSVLLGSDRRYNNYWLFLGPCNADDPGHRRVYFESSEDGHWEVIDTEEALCTLLSVLDDRGKREALLIESLEKRQKFLCQSMSRTAVNSTRFGRMTQSDHSEFNRTREDSHSPVSDVDNLGVSDGLRDSLQSARTVALEVGEKGGEQIQKWNRLQAFDFWVWNSFYSDLNVVKYGKRSYLDSLARCESCHDLFWRDEKHCRICHTTFELDFDLEEKYAIHTAKCREKDDISAFPKHKVLSSQIQSMKAAIHAIESVMPEDALVGAWRKSAHKLWVKRLRRTSSIEDLLQVVADFVGAINEDWLYKCNFPHCVVEEVTASFTVMPHTSSALALWLVKLDAVIAPYLETVRSMKKDTRKR